MKTSTDFFLSGRSIPAWITGLAFLSANLGAQEVIGMGASGAKYGIMTSHFYWVGAIPAMVFVGIFMMPFYYGSRARSVPEYLKLRFDEKTRGFNAISFAVMTVFSSGVSMYALAKLMELLLGWNFHASLIASAVIVLAYILLGGLTSAIYNEVLQFFMIVLGFLPLVFLGLKDIGGWDGLVAKLNAVAVGQHYAPGTWTESWKHMGSAGDNPMGVEWFGMVMGLGFVLSFGYWCTDFLVVQRAMAANSMSAARRTPLIAAIPKMLFPALVILPGMIAMVAAPWAGGHESAQAAGISILGVKPAHGIIPPKLEKGPGGRRAAGDGSRHGPARARLRSGHAHDARPLLSHGDAGLRTDGADGFVHVGHGRQRDGLQHRLDLRHLSELHCAGAVRQSLSLDGPHVHGFRHRHQHRGGLRGHPIQQHHGRAATGVRLRQRAAVRHVHAGHVLAAGHRARGLFRIALRHRGGGRPSRH